MLEAARKLSVVFVVAFLVFSGALYAQSEGGFTKIYFGSLQKDDKSHKSFLGNLFSKRPAKEDTADRDLLCALEFKCPSSPSQKQPVLIPDQLTYAIVFKNTGVVSKNNPLANVDFLKKFMAKIYTKDGRDYTLDLNADAKHISLKEGALPEVLAPGQTVRLERHIDDSYTIYLILGQNIDHMELVRTDTEVQDKYVLDQMEINGGK